MGWQNVFGLPLLMIFSSGCVVAVDSTDVNDAPDGPSTSAPEAEPDNATPENPDETPTSGGTAVTFEPLTGYVASESGDVELEQALFAAGLKGFVGNADGSVGRLVVRVDNSDAETPVIYLSRDGGSETPFSVNGTPEDGEVDLVNATGEILTLTFSEDSDYHPLTIEDDTLLSTGSLGIQTPVTGLLSSGARYTVAMDAEGGSDTLNASMNVFGSIFLNFNDETLSGMAGGNLTTETIATGATESGFVSITVSGTVVDGEIDGDLAVTGGATGSIDMLGAVYGDTGNTVSGGIGGTVNTSGGDVNLLGTFRGGVPVIVGPT